MFLSESFVNHWQNLKEVGGTRGLMVSALVCRSNSPGSSPGLGIHCVVFFGKTLYSQSASLRPGFQMGTGEFSATMN